MAVEGDRLVGSGTVDMKGGDVLALGVMRALAAVPDAFEEIGSSSSPTRNGARGRSHYGDEFAGFDACLCFEGGEVDGAGNDAVVVRRKAAATRGRPGAGRAAHSGAAPELGPERPARARGGRAAGRRANDPAGPDRVTAVPTVIKSGEAFNVVPADGELICDLRGDRLEALEAVLERSRPSTRASS